MTVTLTPLTAGAIFLAFALVLFLFAVKDRAEYQAFKRLTDTRQRRAFFRKWLVMGVLFLGGPALLALAFTGRLEALSIMPSEFAPLCEVGAGLVSFSPAMGAGLVAGVVVVILLMLVGGSRNKEKTVVAVGDVEPLLPRNVGEGFWTAALSVNAGVSEELLFRLVLPLLLVVATGNVWAAFAIPILMFGAMHLYQGIAGIIGTTVVGVLMAVFYVATGNIWVPVAIHAAIDLNGLVLMPALGALAARRRADASSTE